MANITMKQLEKKLKKMSKNLVKESDDYIDEAADMSAKEIRDRTKRGFGVEKDGGSKQKLKKLSPAYVKQRRKQGLTQKSRLGRSDEMLDSIKGEGGKVVLKGRRNREVAEFVQKDRPFFHLTKAERAKVIDDLRDKVEAFWSKFK